jgi:hypothetical protein
MSKSNFGGTGPRTKEANVPGRVDSSAAPSETVANGAHTDIVGMNHLFRISQEDACAYLTQVCSAVGGGDAITAYFMFKGRELYAADLGAYRDDTRQVLRDGFRVVEKAAVLNAADLIQDLAPKISQRSGPFGGFRAVNLGFAHSVLVINSSSPGEHLIGLTHPKEFYIYGAARKTRDRLLGLVANGQVPRFSPEDIRRFRALDPFASAHTAADAAALRSLSELALRDLSKLCELFNRAQFCEPHQSGLSGFLFVVDDGNGRKIKAASSTLTDEARSSAGKIRLRTEYAPLAGPIFLDDTLHTLMQAHDNFGRDTESLPLTGSLRAFWFSFEHAVVGVHLFKSINAGGDSVKYFLVSACHAGSAAEPPFNYDFARRSIKDLCDAAEDQL